MFIRDSLKGLASRDDSVLADKISRLIIWYSLQKRDLSDEDRNYLDTSLVECYRRYGITFDNASVQMCIRDSSQAARRMKRG